MLPAMEYEPCMIRISLIRTLSKVILPICLILLPLLPKAQSINRPIPPGLFSYEYQISSGPLNAYLLLSPARMFMLPANPAYRQPRPIILDSAGYLVWYSSRPYRSVTDFKYDERFGRFTYMALKTFTSGGCMVMNDQMELVDSLQYQGDVRIDSHEFGMLANGNFVRVGQYDTVMDLSAYTFGGVQGSSNTTVIASVVQEIDPSHNLVFQWISTDHIHPAMAYDAYGYNPNGYDYCHINAVEEDSDGNFLLSFRHLNAIYKIDRQNGSVIWSMGGKNPDLILLNDHGFSGQHDIRRTPEGRLSLFDNGNTDSLKRTRSLLIEEDSAGSAAMVVWDYQPNPPFFAGAMGSHQQLPDQDHLIGYGLVYRPYPSVSLVDSAMNLKMQLIFEDSVISYRARMATGLSFPRPEITCSVQNNELILSMPPGYARYIWSNGAQTPDITVTTAGVYQCWIPYGSGMLGSFPFIVEDPADGCGQTSLPENSSADTEDEIIQYTDLCGRIILKPREGCVCIAIYKSGKSKLIIIK